MELTTQNLPLYMGRSLTSGKYTDLWPWYIERLLSVFGRFSSFPWCILCPVMNNVLQTFHRFSFLFCCHPVFIVWLYQRDSLECNQQSSSTNTFLPHCVTAMSDNLQMCTDVGKWTGSQFWQAATRIDDWNGRIFCTKKSQNKVKKH